MHSSEDTIPAARTGHPPFRFSMRQLLVYVFSMCLLMGGVNLVMQMVAVLTRQGHEAKMESRIAHVCYAQRAYHTDHGQFPPAYIADEDGTPMHSWRVLLLPYMGEEALYGSYDFTEPWDGPNNSRLAAQMPYVYRSPAEPQSSHFTNVVAIVGPGTAFPNDESTSLDDFADGPENTIFLAETGDSRVQWLEPRDLDVHRMSFALNDDKRPSISTVRRDGTRPIVAFDDITLAIEESISPGDLHSLTTIAGGEPVTRKELEEAGHLVE